MITPNMLMSATTAASESRMVKAGTPLPPCQNPAPMGRGVAELGDVPVTDEVAG
jgi:hypothetical protein